MSRRDPEQLVPESGPLETADVLVREDPDDEGEEDEDAEEEDDEEEDDEKEDEGYSE
jgi:hypothetical protein